MTLRVVKVGTSLLRGQKGQTTADVIDQLTTALAESLDRGDRAVLVSSGAVGLGCRRLGRERRPEEWLGFKPLQRSVRGISWASTTRPWHAMAALWLRSC